MGHFLGFLDYHSSLVMNTRNLRASFVSPQFYVIFDDLFQTVFSLGDNDVVVDAILINCLKVIEMPMLRMNSVWMGNRSILPLF